MDEDTFQVETRTSLLDISDGSRFSALVGPALETTLVDAASTEGCLAGSCLDEVTACGFSGLADVSATLREVSLSLDADFELTRWFASGLSKGADAHVSAGRTDGESDGDSEPFGKKRSTSADRAGRGGGCDIS